MMHVRGCSLSVVVWTTAIVHMSYGSMCSEPPNSGLPVHVGNCIFNNTLCCYTQGVNSGGMSEWTATPDGAKAYQVSQQTGNGDSAITRLESPLLNITEVACVEFSYISFAPSSLNLIVFDDMEMEEAFRGRSTTVYSDSPIFTTISKSTTKIRFSAVGGGGAAQGSSGVRLKEVKIHTGNCRGPECSFNGTLCGWEGSSWDIVKDTDSSRLMVANLMSAKASGNLTTDLVRAAHEDGCLHFDFLMDEVNDTLTVFSKNGSMQLLWTMVSRHSRLAIWSKASVPIMTNSAFRVIFEARRCSTMESRIRIDNVRFWRDRRQCDFSPPEASPDNSLLEAECGRHTTTTTTTTAPITSLASNTTNNTNSPATTAVRPPTPGLTPADTTTGPAITTITPDTTTTNSPATYTSDDSTSNPADTTTTTTTTTTTDPKSAGPDIAVVAGSVAAAVVVVVLIIIIIVLWRKRIICTERGFYSKFKNNRRATKTTDTRRKAAQPTKPYAVTNLAFDVTDDDQGLVTSGPDAGTPEPHYSQIAEDGAPGTTRQPTSNDDYNRLQMHPSNQQLLRSPSLPEDDYSHIVTQSQNLQHSAPSVAELHNDAPQTEKGRDDAAKTSISSLSQGDSGNAERQHADHGSDGVDVHSDAENANTQVDDGYTLPSTGGALLAQSSPPGNGYSEVGTHPSGLQPLNPLNADLYSDVEITKVDEGYTLPSTGEAMLADLSPPENGYSQTGTFPADIQPPNLLDADSDVQAEGKQQEVHQKPAAEKSVKFSLPPADGYSQNEDQLPEPPTPEGEDRGELYSKVHKTNGENALQAPEEPRDSALYSQVHKKGKGDVTTQPPGEATAQSPGDATEDQLYSTVDKKKPKPVIPKKPTIAKKPVQ